LSNGLLEQSTISAPLLVASGSNLKESIRAFKVIQHIMGDRDRPVEGIVPVPTSRSATHLAAVADEDLNRENIGLWDRTETKWLLEEERWLLQLGITTQDLRDEIYSQCIKQLSRNPDR
jgi:hypothetical protein